MSEAAALLFVAAAAVAIAFQVALALGAPWGEYAMGGRYPGRFPPPMRVAAVVQAAVIGGLALIVATRAGLIDTTLDPQWIWAVVTFSTVSLILNALSRSPAERRLWVPIALVLSLTSVAVALGP